MGLGRYLYAVAAILLGAVGLLSGQLTGVWQPTPDIFEGSMLFPYAIAGLFLVGGIAALWPATERIGALILASLYFVFALLWVKRIELLPLVSGTWGGFAEELAPSLAGVLIALRPAWTKPWRDVAALTVIRILFGLCAIAYGFNHFFALPQTTALVPSWLPPGESFWAIATGVADVAAGIAFLALVVPVLAARLLTLMFATYSALIWIPALVRSPTAHASWSVNAVNLVLISAVWVFADSLAARRNRTAKSAGFSTH